MEDAAQDKEVGLEDVFAFFFFFCDFPMSNSHGHAAASFLWIFMVHGLEGKRFYRLAVFNFFLTICSFCIKSCLLLEIHLSDAIFHNVCHNCSCKRSLTLL